MPLAQSVRERILVQLVIGMNAGAEKPGTTWRTRVDAFNSGELPAYVLYATASAPERKGPGITYHELTVRVECLVKGEPPLDSALDPMLVYAVQAMFGVCESLQQVKLLEEGPVQWEVEPAYEDVAVAVCDFRVTFATAANDPTLEK